MDSADNGQFLASILRIAIDKNSNSSFQLFICKFSNRQNFEFIYILWNPLTFAGSPFKFCGLHLHLRILLKFCGIHLQLLNPEQLAIFACCGVRDSTNVPNKTYVTSIYTRNPRKSCYWNPLTFWIIIKSLSMESRNIQTQNFAPIQCTVWTRCCVILIQSVKQFEKSNSILYVCIRCGG